MLTLKEENELRGSIAFMGDQMEKQVQMHIGAAQIQFHVVPDDICWGRD